MSEIPITSPKPVRFPTDIVLASSTPEMMLAFEFWMERIGPGSTLETLLSDANEITNKGFADFIWHSRRSQ